MLHPGYSVFIIGALDAEVLLAEAEQACLPAGDDMCFIRFQYPGDRIEHTLVVFCEPSFLVITQSAFIANPQAFPVGVPEQRGDVVVGQPAVLAGCEEPCITGVVEAVQAVRRPNPQVPLGVLREGGDFSVGEGTAIGRALRRGILINAKNRNR